ncbi:MAG: hypothetical protein HFE51_06425 [Clostridia bacterium]|nr:hypothetical protein [Clostridia bacterium]
MNRKILRVLAAAISAAMLITSVPVTFAETEFPVDNTFTELDTAEAVDTDEIGAEVYGEEDESFLFKADALETKTYNANVTVGKVTLYASSSRSVEVRDSNKTIDNEKFEKYIRLSGMPDLEENGKTPARYLEFTTQYGGVVTVYAASANANEERNLIVGGNTMACPGTPIAASYNLEKGTVRIYAENGINLHGIKFVSNVSAPQTDEEWISYINNKIKISDITNDTVNFDALTDSFELIGEYTCKYDDNVQKDVTITSWTSSNETVVKIDGRTATVIRPRFNEKKASAVLTAEILVGETVMTKEFYVTVSPLENPEGDEKFMMYAEKQIKSLGFDVSTDKVATGDIYLPTEITLSDGSVIATVEWTSSDTSYIANDGTVVNYPEGSHSLTMTAVIKAGALTQTHTYNVVLRRSSTVKAFPGAQGYGTQTRGGAGGYIVHVTSLGASGPGTLKEAVEDKTGARTIVFDVGGTIDLTSLGRALRMSGEDDSNVTIAGQTAPGEGIQLKGYGLTLSSVHDVIIRNISIRIGNVRKAGDTYQSDPLSAQGANKRVVLDHLSMCWAVDMGFRAYGQEITMSNCMISKGLYWNTPHEKGKHNYAGIFGPKYGSFYGNYIADCGQRAPRICDNEYIDVRNNVVSNSKYTFDICNYEWMGANTKYNVVNNVVLRGNGAPGGSNSNVTKNGSYKYFQGRTYSGGVFSYSVNNYDNTVGARPVKTNEKNVEGALWTGDFSADKNNSAQVSKELGAFNAGGYSNIVSTWQDMILPDNISLSEYDASAVSKKGNTLVNYPFVVPDMKTYSANEAAKYVLSNAGAVIGRGENDEAPRKGILDSRYLAEGKTRLQILSDYSKASSSYGIKIDKGYTDETAYGLPVHTHTVYKDERGAIVYDVDGINVPDPTGYTVEEQYKFVSCDNHLDSLYAIDKKGNKYRLVMREYTENDGIYDTFELYDISNNQLTKPDGYATKDTGNDGYIAYGGVSMKCADWGDGAGNYDHANSGGNDGFLGTDVVDTEWTDDDWPQLPTVYRDGKFDSNGDGIPDFFIRLMGWDKHPEYSPSKDISMLDFEGRGYTNLEYYINDYCAGDTEIADSEENDPINAENVRDGSPKYDTHKSHEILFNTVRRAKAEVYYCEGTDFNLENAQKIALNSNYDYGSTGYNDAKDFETYFSAILDGLKPDTAYSYKIMIYSDKGVTNLSSDTYTFRTRVQSSGKPGQPRVIQYIPFDEQITLTFEPASAQKSYKTMSAGSHTVKTIGNNEYDNSTDHYILRYSTNKDMSGAKSVELPSTTTKYVLKGLSNDKEYYLELRAVSGDGTESDSAVYNAKKAKETSEKDKDGNAIYKVEGISVSSNSIIEYPKEYDVPLSGIAIIPTKYVVNEDYAKNIKNADIGEGDTTKFITVYGDEKDWYIYTLGGIPIPTSIDGSDPILMLRDDNHDHGFTYAKKFDTILDGQSTIRARIMIKDEELDPMNQAPEFRFYIQQDSADLGDSDADVEQTGENTATTFGNIVTLQFTKNDIIFNGSNTISKYYEDTWYDIKLLMDADRGTCNLYINDSLVGKDLEYSDSATSNNIARWQISSRLAGTQDVYVDYMYAYKGWEEPATGPEVTKKPDNEVGEGTSGVRPSGGGGGGGPTGGTTPKPSETAKPVETQTPDSTDKPVKSGFDDMKGFEWAENAVNELHNREIVYGITESLFEPGRDVTRAEFITMLLRGFELIGEDAQCSFEDVPSGSWYYPAVAMAYSMGIVSGYSDTVFGANDKISRQDMAVMTVRLLTALGLNLESVRDYTGFEDENEISDYAKPSVVSLYQSGIINGVGDNRFDPKGSANRAASAVILYQTLKWQWSEDKE